MITAESFINVYQVERYFNGRVHTLFIGKHWVSAKELGKAVALAERISRGTVVYNTGRKVANHDAIQ